MPAAVAAAFFPPKSIDAVPESIECTMDTANELTTKARMMNVVPGATLMVRSASTWRT